MSVPAGIEPQDWGLPETWCVECGKATERLNDEDLCQACEDKILKEDAGGAFSHVPDWRKC